MPKIKYYFIIIPISILIIFYFLIENRCLNLSKTFKSYKDFGYSNIRPCYIGSTKNLIRQKLPKIFDIISDVNRAYFGKYDKDILKLELENNYESMEEELYEEVIKFSKDGLKGLVNTNYETFKISNTNEKKYYKSYVRQNKDNSNSKYYNLNLKKIDTKNKPSLVWSHKTMETGIDKPEWKKLTETSPIYFKNKIFYITADLRFFAINAVNGNIIWEKELLHYPSMRGFLIEEDLQGNENIYLPVGSKIYKINANDGQIIKYFGKQGAVKFKTSFSPFIYKENLVIVSPNTVNIINKKSGKKVSSISIFEGKKFMGALPWGGAALDEKRGLVYFTTGNPRPKVYGVKRPGINDRSDSFIAVDLENKKVLWKLQETFHDLWNLDIAFPPILTTINVNKKKYDVVIALTKVGNFLMLERVTGKPIFDVGLIKTPIRSNIKAEVTSPFQLSVKNPEPITKFDWTLNDISQLKENRKKKIVDNLEDYDFGLYVPPKINKRYIYLAEGPIWEGAAIDPKKQRLFSTVNHTPSIMRAYLKSLWPHSNIKKKFKEEFKLYKNNCSSCHGINRNGIYKTGKGSTKSLEQNVIPNLVGYHLFDDLRDKITDYDNYKKKHQENVIDEDKFNKINKLFFAWDKDLYKNKRINVNVLTASFVDKDKNFFMNYPQGELVSYDLKTGKKIWKKPFGYENNKNIGTFNRGGLALSKDGTIFATGTPDKKIFAFDSENGNELWSYQMEIAGSAPPIMFEQNGSKYLAVIAVGGYHFKFPDRGSILYTFKLN